MTTDSNHSSCVVGWSGHRHLADEAAVSKAVAAVMDRLAGGGGDGCRRSVVGIGSVAIGSDTIIAEAFRARGLPLIVMLPFELDRFEADADADRRSRIMRLVDEARLGRIMPRMPSDEQAFLEAGVSMVDLIDVLIVVWDGQQSRGVGGTKDVIDFARELGKPVIRIDPAGNIDWPARGLPGPPADSAPPGLRSRVDVEEVFNGLDHVASEHSTLSRLVLFWIIALHLGASAVAIGAAILWGEAHGHHQLAWSSIVPSVIKVGALIWAFVLAWTYRPKHRHWLEARSQAELCRSFLAIWDMRRDVITLPPAPTFSTESLRRELELAWLLDAPRAADMAAARQTYLFGSGNRDPANPGGRMKGQLRYFNRGKLLADAVGHKLKQAAIWTTGSAIVLGMIGIVMTWCGWENTTSHIVKALSIILPLLTAAMLSYATARDLTRRIARFREMADRLRILKRRVRAARTWPSLGRAVTDAEWVLQAELGEWHAFTRYAGEPHS